ncbi:hypothetical protein VNI00_009567 [Paramarasmius palmivorus]|uniref:Clavaminate synthase-like protein n=1 Tax=Paramarasmius palmivorus TaxID=297713 RepID=A0AAW0CRW8_9AGAR
MPVPTPQLGSYKYVPETNENLDWAELITIDLGQYGTPEGKKKLAEQLIYALREKGFFYVKNFNISQGRVDRQFALGRELYELPLEAKEKYIPEGLDQGKFNGYVPAGRRLIDPETGLRDRLEMYNIPKFNGFFPQNHPQIIQDNIQEIEDFARSLHSEVLDPLFVLLAIALELPEDTFKRLHQYPVKSEDHLRYMKYGKYDPADNEKLSNWIPGHTDLGSFTLLFRQPVAALQIKLHDSNEWKWVKPQDATLTVNACDALSFLTGGYVKSTIHRQVLSLGNAYNAKGVTEFQFPRKISSMLIGLGYYTFLGLSVLLFSETWRLWLWPGNRPHNDVQLSTIKESPVLQREGYTQNQFESTNNPVPTMEEWTFAKQKWQRTKGYTDDIKHMTATILPGFNEKLYA